MSHTGLLTDEYVRRSASTNNVGATLKNEDMCQTQMYLQMLYNYYYFYYRIFFLWIKRYKLVAVNMAGL